MNGRPAPLGPRSISVSGLRGQDRGRTQWRKYYESDPNLNCRAPQRPSRIPTRMRVSQWSNPQPSQTTIGIFTPAEVTSALISSSVLWHPLERCHRCCGTHGRGANPMDRPVTEISTRMQ